MTAARRAFDAMTAPTAVAEFNLGRLRYGWDDPRTAEFAEALDAVYAVAARSPGFVWMMPEPEMDAAQRDPNGPLGGDPLIASTLSVWRSVADLRAFTFDTLHGRYMARRGEWLRPGESHLVLWRVDPAERPSVDEGVARLERLLADGPSAHAFGWRDAERFAPAAAPSLERTPQ